MKRLVYVILSTSIVTGVLAVVTKFASFESIHKGFIAGVGPTGYLVATLVLLLLSANLALLELLHSTKK